MKQLERKQEKERLERQIHQQMLKEQESLTITRKSLSFSMISLLNNINGISESPSGSLRC